MALTRASAAVIKTEEIVNNRNRIINGDMRIDQRNAGAAVTINTTANIYVMDRWRCRGESSDGAFTCQQDSDVPSGQGFKNSAKITVTTADASIGVNQLYGFQQLLEGFNVADLDWGTASAKTVTLSFWVRSSLTGTFSGALSNSVPNRSYPFTYTISSANTWEQKTITIVGDTTGTWESTNGWGIRLSFSLGSGSNFIGTAGAWNANNNLGATGETAVIGTLNATWYITGVQLEVGSVATPFERRPYGTELQLCERYFKNWVSPGQIYMLTGHVWSTTLCQYSLLLNPTMRAQPTISTTGTISNLSGQSAVGLSSISLDSGVIYDSKGKQVKINGNMSSSAYTSGYACALLLNSDGASLSLSAEL